MIRTQLRGALILITFLLILVAYLRYSSFPVEEKPIEEKRRVRYDLNKVDSVTLVGVPGIGPKRAQAIFQYRRMWGGFRSTTELAHLVYFSEEAAAQLEPYFFVQDSVALIKRKLTSFSYPSLVASGLFTKKEAYLIQKYKGCPDSLREKLSLETYRKLEYYFLLPHSGDCVNSPQVKVRYEINRVTMEDLQTVSCLPKWLKERFFKYRARLGYFVSLEQVKEIYGIQPQHVKCFQQFFYLDVNALDSLPKISLNRADVKALLRLPYLPKEMAHRIVKYRQKVGVFDSLPELYQVYGMDSVLYQKIVPYLGL
jgi:DNA uptake protein ComE-like DNA-binding protein